MTELPQYQCTVVAKRQAADVWLIRTPVVDGGPSDYTEYELFNMGPQSGGMTTLWAVRSIRANIGGVEQPLMDQSAFQPGQIGTVEYAMRVGRMTEPLSAFDFYGSGHGQLTYTGLLVCMDGSGNVRDLPVGAVLRGNSLIVDSTYTAKLLDGTPIGSVEVGQIFDAGGMRIVHKHVITAAGIGMQNSYSAMLPATGCDRVQAINGQAITIGTGSGAQVGNWGPTNSFALWNSARPETLLEMTLPYGGPGNNPYGWSECTTSTTFLLDNPRNQKLYINARSGTAPVPFSGTYTYLTLYRVRRASP